MKKIHPKVSIIMPFYNCEKFLTLSIDSILKQSFKDFEYIIINDASIDHSDDIVCSYKDKRIIYIKNKERKNIVYNLNKALELAKWEYIIRMDWDDISLLDRIKKQVDFLDKNKNISIVWWYVELIDEENNNLGILKKPLSNKTIKDEIFLYSPFVHPSVCYKKEEVLKYMYREKYLYLEDYDLWLRMIYYWLKWANLNEVILKYRRHRNVTNNNSNLIAKKSLELRKEILKKYKLNLNYKRIISIYLHYFLWILLSWKQKEKMEKILKKIRVKNNVNSNILKIKILYFLRKTKLYYFISYILNNSFRKYDHKVQDNILLEKNKAIYLLVSKVGSTTSKKILADILKLNNKKVEYNLKYEQINFPSVHRVQLNTKYKNYYKFAFVRNPYDRIISCFFDKIKNNDCNEHPYINWVYDNFLTYWNFYAWMSFKNFVKEILKIDDRYIDKHLTTQTRLLSDKNWKIIPDFIWRVENLENDYNKILNKIWIENDVKIPRFKKTNYNDYNNYRDYYDEETKKLVAERYKKDLELFNYEF